MSTHALTEKAMVLTLSIGIWQGYRLDKQATAEITAAKGASSDAARVNKHLIPKEALASIVTASGAIRTHFYTHTLPWRDNGDRLMPRVKFTSFIEEHEGLVTAFKDEVDAFLTDGYPRAIEQAGFRMGEMFNRDDYPSVSELRHRFYADLDYGAVTSADDFRVQIDEAHVDKVRQAMEKAAEERVQRAQADVWSRLLEKVSYFHERMVATTDEGKPAVFRDTLLSNIEELVELVPGLNVLDDPNIERMRVEIKQKLTGHDVKDIRKHPELRQDLAGEAKEIVDKMAGFMRAFGVKQEETV